MISKELFIKTINLMEKYDSEIDKWIDFGLDIFETPLCSIPCEIFNCWIDSHFNTDGKDWIDWYLYERKSIITKEILPCYDENDNKFYVNSVEDLWNIVKDYRLNGCSFKSEKCSI